MSITIGQRLAGYQVLSLPGRGGMGEVYRARDTHFQRDVALKVLPQMFAFDQPVATAITVVLNWQAGLKK